MKLDKITNKQSGFLYENTNKNDEYYTPNYAIEPILEYLNPSSYIWCPFDLEDSNYVKLLRKNGHKVICSHIGTGGDFFTYDYPNDIDYIISNPPYSLKYEVFKRLFEIGKPFAMLVGVVGLFESQKRFTMFSENTFEVMYFDKRISYFQDYSDAKPKLNPPFSSVYITKDLLPDRMVFKRIIKR